MPIATLRETCIAIVGKLCTLAPSSLNKTVASAVQVLAADGTLPAESKTLLSDYAKAADLDYLEELNAEPFNEHACTEKFVTARISSAALLASQADRTQLMDSLYESYHAALEIPGAIDSAFSTLLCNDTDGTTL